MSNMNINQEIKKGWQNKWSNYEDNILIDNYSKLPIEELLELLPNRNKKSIQQHAFKLNLKYLYYNENYFEKIDNSEKAYWLGFIYADGCVTTQDRFGITLSKIDDLHLLKFSKCIDSNIKIRYGVNRKIDTEMVKTKKETEYCSITFKNKKLHDDLENKGVIRNKTYSLRFPSEEILPNELIKDFIRGYFDGDGCYVYSVKNRVRKDRNNKIYPRLTKEISATGYCEGFFLDLIKIIKERCGVDFKLYYNPKGNMPTIRIFDKDNIYKFLNYIYYENCICLDRKYEKVKELLKYCLSQ